MTFETAFKKIKDKFAHADASQTPDFAIQITFIDADCGGTFCATVRNGKLAVEPYDYRDNDTVLNITKSALLAFLAGRRTLANAIAAGDAVVYGNENNILDWRKTIKAAPVKKAAVAKKQNKKAPSKKIPQKKTTQKASVKKNAKNTKK